MRIYFFTLCLCACGLMQAQKFRPYHVFGLQANAVLGRMPKEMTEDAYGPVLRYHATHFDVLAAYDYAPLNWLGISSGLGLSVRGGKGSRNKKDIYYLNIPLKLQIKLGFLWLEPGVENKFFLGLNSQNTQTRAGRTLTGNDIHFYHLSATIGGRIELFRGLSLNIGYGWSLTPLAYMEHVNDSQLNATYQNRSWFFGIRYMFNQPYK